MTKIIWVLLILCWSRSVFGQEFEKSIYDSLIGNMGYEKELRIRTDVSVANQYGLTRIYQDSSQNWFLEKYISNGKQNKFTVFIEQDELDKTIAKDSIYLVNTNKVFHKNLGKKFNKTWLELLITNILDLSSLEEIEYKLRIKKVIEEKRQYEILEDVKLIPNDGIYYIIEIKDQKRFNRVEINNPEFYIDLYPKIDEFEYLDSFLKLTKKILKTNN